MSSGFRCPIIGGRLAIALFDTVASGSYGPSVAEHGLPPGRTEWERRIGGMRKAVDRSWMGYEFGTGRGTSGIKAAKRLRPMSKNRGR